MITIRKEISQLYETDCRVVWCGTERTERTVTVSEGRHEVRTPASEWDSDLVLISGCVTGRMTELTSLLSSLGYDPS